MINPPVEEAKDAQKVIKEEANEEDEFHDAMDISLKNPILAIKNVD